MAVDITFEGLKLNIAFVIKNIYCTVIVKIVIRLHTNTGARSEQEKENQTGQIDDQHFLR